MVLLLDEGDPARASLDAAVAAARRLHPGRRAAKLLQPLRAEAQKDEEGASILGPAFEYREVAVVPTIKPHAGMPTPGPMPSQHSRMRELEPLQLDGLLAASAADGSSATTPVLAGAPGSYSPLPPPPPSTSVALSPAMPPLALGLPPQMQNAAPAPAFDLLQPEQQAFLQPQPQQLQPAPARVGLTTMITEDLTMVFSASRADITISLQGQVQLAVASPQLQQQLQQQQQQQLEKLPDFECLLRLLDRGDQIATARANPSLLSEADGKPPATMIPEAGASPGSVSTAPGGEYRCRIPKAVLPAAPHAPPASLALLAFEAKPSVRPVPVRLQHCGCRVEREANALQVLAQVSANPGLFLPLSGVSLAVQVLVPGVELDTHLASASPAVGARWVPPVLQWTLAAEEELRPGQALVFKAFIPIKHPSNGDGVTNAAMARQGEEGVAAASSWPLRALFKAQSRAALTKVAVQVAPADGGGDSAAYDIQHEARRRFRVTAKFEP